jgi:hypothetical protein
MENMKNTISQIVTEALDQARMEACTSMLDRTANLADVTMEINISVDSIKFDTATAKNMFLGFCFAELRKVAPSLYPAKVAMDVNGNYTSNSKLWA